MERLLSDAEKLTGVHYDISNLSDVYDAIHAIQEEMGVTGTTALEAEKTITGSVNSMKAAFNNWLSGAGGITEVVESLTTVGKNISNAIIEMLPSLIEGIQVLIDNIVKQLPGLLEQILPMFVSGVFAILKQLVEIIIDSLPTLIQMLVDNLPTIITEILNLALMIITSLSEQLPDMLPMIIEAILDLIPLLLENAPLFIEAMFKIGLALLEGLIKSIPEIIKAIPGIIKELVNAWGDLKERMKNIGKDLVKGLWEGLKSSYQWIKDKISGWVGDILKFIKKLFGISSPSKKTKQDGVYIAQGLANGILEGLPMVQRAVDKMSGAVNGTLENDVNIKGGSGQTGGVIINFYAQTLDDGQVNKVVREVNKQLGSAY